MSQVIADRAVMMRSSRPVFRLPNFPIPAGFKDAEDYLWDLINKGIANGTAISQQPRSTLALTLRWTPLLLWGSLITS
jgi:hypothetical protein